MEGKPGTSSEPIEAEPFRTRGISSEPTEETWRLTPPGDRKPDSCMCWYCPRFDLVDASRTRAGDEAILSTTPYTERARPLPDKGSPEGAVYDLDTGLPARVGSCEGAVYDLETGLLARMDSCDGAVYDLRTGLPGRHGLRSRANELTEKLLLTPIGDIGSGLEHRDT